MRTLLTQSVIQVSAEDRLADVTRLIAEKAASYCVVLERPHGEFLGVVRVRDAMTQPAGRIFADLISSVPTYRVARSVPRTTLLEMVDLNNIPEAVMLTNTGKFIGVVTRESLREWQYKEQTRSHELLQIRTTSCERILAKLQKKIRQQALDLKQAIAQLDEFSYAVSHDVRTPLRAMQGYAMALLEEHSPHLDESAKSYVQRIIRASHRLDLLTMGVLAYGEISRVKVSIRRQNLSRLLHEVIDAKRSVFPSAEIEVQQPLIKVRADRALLMLALSQLLDNALKFIAVGEVPSVRIWTENNGEYARLLIEDKGIGIRAENRERVFHLFERLHPEEAFAGAGVGLALVRKAVEKMGGRVGIEAGSKSGARFWLEFSL